MIKREKSLKEQGVNSGKKTKTALRFAMEFLVKIAVTAVVIILLLNYVIGIYPNHSNASYPMIKDGDLCATFRLAKYNLEDEIVYIQDGKARFGRIVGMPGDIVDISDGNLTVNGYGVYEDAVYPTKDEGAAISFPYTVPKETVFVLNDYRSDPTDSRFYGGIPLKKTKGKVMIVLRIRGI